MSLRKGGTFFLTSNSSPKDFSGCPEVKGSTKGLDIAPLAQEFKVLEFVPVEVAAHVDTFAPDNYHLVPVEEKFGHDR